MSLSCLKLSPGSPWQMPVGVPGLVATILREMAQVQAAAVRRLGAAEPLGINCVMWALLACRRGCLGLQDQVAGIVVRACALGANRGQMRPAMVLEVAAGEEDDWAVQLAAVESFFRWRPGAAGDTPRGPA